MVRVVEPLGYLGEDCMQTHQQPITVEHKTTVRSDVIVQPLQEADLNAADRVYRLAFGAFLGMEEPLDFGGDANVIQPRWWESPYTAFAAKICDELVGSSFATRWGSFGFLGPLSVNPEFWDQGIATQLIEPVLHYFTTCAVRQVGVFSFTNSPKHLGLYQKFGFWPRYLSIIMQKPVQHVSNPPSYTIFSKLTVAEQHSCIQACREITDSIYEGLDLEHEIRMANSQLLGEVIMLSDNSRLNAFAVCHLGPASEAGTGCCYIKFAATRSGAQAEKTFNQLLQACEHYASTQELTLLRTGVNTSRNEAYQQALTYGFSMDIIGLAMHRPNEPAFCRAGIYVLDDWR